MAKLFESVLLIGIFPIIYFFLNYLFAQSYIVHEKGVVFITGSSTGIGRHAVEYLANNTNFLVVAGVRKKEDVQAINNIKKNNLVAIIIDVSSRDSVKSATAEIANIMKSKNLPLVGVVNNAGIGRHIPLEFHDLDDFKYLFDTNIFGAIDVIQNTLPLLRKDQGRIIMMSSVSGKVGNKLKF